MKTDELFLYDRSIGGIIAGVDEAGRGPLAGPVVCAACIMGDNFIDGVNDSKKISEKKRESLYERITEKAVSFGIGIVCENDIDEVNILNATKIGMKIAVNSLSTTPDIVLIDAVKDIETHYKQQAIIRGDATSYSIAAASIIAKVTRDRIMREYDLKYPEYGFARNKGYGTAEHISALKKYGPCELHRRSFIKKFVNE